MSERVVQEFSLSWWRGTQHGCVTKLIASRRHGHLFYLSINYLSPQLSVQFHSQYDLISPSRYVD